MIFVPAVSLPLHETSFLRVVDNIKALPVYNWCRVHRMLRSKVEQYFGKSKYVQRTPVMVVGVAREIFTEEMILRTQVFQSKGWR